MDFRIYSTKNFGVTWVVGVWWCGCEKELENAVFGMAVASAQLRNDDRNNEENKSGFKIDLAAILFVVQ